MIPGEYIHKKTDIVCNEGRKSIKLLVTNTGDRPVQVGSHYHFYEVNDAFDFDRDKSYGKRLDIPAGAAVRFEPGDKKEVELIDYAGKREVYGFHNKVDGPLKK
ncbi:urease subunit beta [Marixanthomonas spongiae]|uniref:Urease subunit beta n=1 Tax=Marixanthomonas spongiae TaxID=2174845 RepID=A0A2U0I0K0_9FLAO|nr:urease subunit beta [Marixanthomonas spongiae]PVW14635.1 urease subunit beta [Marixanthomonas spongiae]